MPSETIYKTVYQYNKAPVSAADMKKLQEIARACRDVRNAVYERYGGIRGLPKINPGYAAQNEMTKSEIREQLGLPAVHFYISIFDALGDIKGQWTYTKKQIEKNIRANPNLTPEDRHYLRFVMKQSQCFEAVLAGSVTALKEAVLARREAASKEMVPGGSIPGRLAVAGTVSNRSASAGKWVEQYTALCENVDTHRLNQYLRRQVRRHLEKPHTDAADGFSVSPKGYRYGDHGIYLTTKERGRRIFIPLTDNNRYDRQIYIRLYPAEGKIRISIPVEVRQRHPAGYEGDLGLAIGLKCMFVTDQGRAYGEKYLEYQSALTDYVRERLSRHRKNAKNNPGMKKYYAGKARLEKTLHDYVNAEINRMLDREKPGRVCLPKLPATPTPGYNRRINATVSMWQRGYIRSRLERKCRERSIEFVEVFGKGIGIECCRCGEKGKRDGEWFNCPSCGNRMPERQNTAGNVLKRGRMTQGEKIGEKTGKEN